MQSDPPSASDDTVRPSTVQESGRQGGASGPRYDAGRFEQIIDSMPTAVYAIDAEGRVSYYNRAAAELAGREPIIGSDLWCVTWKLFYPDGSPMPHDECPMAVTFKERREVRGAEAIVERPDGSRIWMQPYPALLRDELGNIIGAVNILIDITERKRAAKALAEADRRKDEFLAMLAHELRNPLAPIHNGLHVLRKSSGEPQAAHRVREMMERQVAHLIRLVDDLMDVSRIATGKIELKKEETDLATLLDLAIEETRHFIEAGGLELRLNLSGHALPLAADPVRITQAFTNLLNNAAKFTDAGGWIEIASARRGDEAVVHVSDSGMGIPSDMLERVFDLFTQAHRQANYAQGGLGVGLALVREIVQLHGGRVELHSEGRDQGSRFTVYLPLLSALSSERVAGETGADAAPTPRRVLIIDDNRDVADSLAMLLQALEADVRVAYDGREGLEQLMSFAAEIIFLDLGMPGMDGFETARRIRKASQGRKVKIVALTGWGEEATRNRVKDADFDDHVTKPMDFSRLARLLGSA
jgi:PAS domain S-box-containing protein